MDEKEYQELLSQVLSAHNAKAANQIRLIIDSLPEKATSLDLQIFPCQEEEGAFSVRAGLDGPDLVVLNQAIDHCADIFEVIYTEDGFEPDVPMLDPFDCDFPISDTIADCVARWLKDTWTSLDNVQSPIPVKITSPDGYGTIAPIQLQK